MTSRFELRERYIQGWYQLDAEKLLSATTADFLFEDPRESKPVTRADLENYMRRWDKWTRAQGADNQWRLTHEVRQDKDGVLTDWEWWELLGTDIQGAAFVLTRDQGVFLEKITYFSRNS